MSKKMMSTLVNFSNLWPKLLNWKHHKWKNRKASSSTNQILKDKIEKKINYTKKDPKQKKNVIKKMSVKIK
jgi:hypothetical protein